VWLVAPLVIYLIKKNRSRYVRYHEHYSKLSKNVMTLFRVSPR